MPGMVCPGDHEKASSFYFKRVYSSRSEVARGVTDVQALPHRLAQSMPRFMISSASGTSKSLLTWPSEE